MERGMKPILLALALAVAVPAVQAAMFRCPSPFGPGTVVTNGLDATTAAERGCEPLQVRRSTLDGPTAGSGQAARAADDWMAPRKAPVAVVRTDAAPAGPAPARRIDPIVQRERDADRRSILDDELARELKARDEVSRRAGAAKDPAQREPLATQLQRHAANIEALQREIARLR
jgi:hypothetical protein